MGIKETEPKILQLKSIAKKFPGVQALDNIDLDLLRGEVHVILGENGAGKSTLIKIISGVYQPDQGQIILNNVPLINNSPRLAKEYGIFTIYQGTSLIPALSVVDNMFLGEEIANFSIIDYKKQEEMTKDYMSEFGYNIDPQTLAGNLTAGELEIVEICKAISKDVKILILDEPTAPLTDVDRNKLFEVIRKLKSEGVAIIYISHRLREAMIIGDKVTILRDGKHVTTKGVNDIKSVDEIIFYMTGKYVAASTTRVKKKDRKTLLKVKNLTRQKYFKNITFDLCSSEIMGVFGLVGCGSEELGRSIFGADSFDEGEIILYQNKSFKIISNNNPKESILNKVTFLPTDRKKDGLVMNFSVKDNITLSSLNYFSKFGVLGKMNFPKEIAISKEYVRLMNIKTPSLNQQVQFLSGGNQQKVLLSRALCCESKIFILNCPTVGIDVGAKREIYNLMDMIVENGSSIIMISYELPEIIEMSDKILIMHAGEISKRYDRSTDDIEITEEEVLKYAFGEGKK